MRRNKTNQRRRTTHDEVIGWFTASDERQPTLTRERIIEKIKAKNAYRWWRLNHDYKWLQRQCKKMGLNPNEARELL